jgi:hypothetical protein
MNPMIKSGKINPAVIAWLVLALTIIGCENASDTAENDTTYCIEGWEITKYDYDVSGINILSTKRFGLRIQFIRVLQDI